MNSEFCNSCQPKKAMKIEKKKLEKSQIEFSVELPYEEFKPFVEQGASELSKEMKIEGFRPGKAPFNIVKAKVGEMAILQEAAHIAINKMFSKILDEQLGEDEAIGQPSVEITKLAPENPLSFKITMATLPSVELGAYKDLNVKKTEAKADEQEVDKTIEYLRESRAKEVVVDREIKKGDKVIANVEMFLDKVPLEGGQAKDTTIMVGKEYFVPGFDDKVVGAKKGQVLDFQLPYPKDFHQKNIAGKNVEFRVTVKDVFEREVAAADDDLAKAFGAKDMTELKTSIQNDILSHKKFEADRRTELDVLDKVLSGAKFGDIPDMLVNNESQKMMMELEENVSRQGGKMEDYLKSIKKTSDQLVMEMLPEAVKRVKTALIIRQIAQVEKMEATDKEVEDKQNSLLEQYKGYEKVEGRIKDPGYRAYLKNSIVNQKVVGKLVEWNTKADDGKDSEKK
jgi:trigger factor